MISKHTRPYDEQKLTASNRLAANIEDLFAENVISGSRCQNILNQVVDAGVPNLAGKKRTGSFKNAARALKRNKLSKTFWPDLYEFQGPVWSRRLNKAVTETLAIWLPLELLEMIWELGFSDVILSTDHMDTQTKEHLDALRAELGLPDLLGAAIHGDGIPNNYDRTESCHAISLNLPGVGGKWARMRIPLCVIPSSKICDATMDAIMEVIAWSFRHLLSGCHPQCRHDGTPWHQSDKSRAKKEGPLGFNAALVEVRGDWEFYSKVFHFPYHNELDGICWMCNCKRNQDPVFTLKPELQQPDPKIGKPQVKSGDPFLKPTGGNEASCLI